jgi:shikimate dehydrogenase
MLASQLGDAARERGATLTVLHWQDEGALAGTSLLVNTTSLGMTGQPPLEVDLAPLPAEALVTDIVYSPLETGLLAAARARGHVVVDGLGMLLHQARPGFRAWFGVDPEVTDALRATVLAGLG